MRRQLCWVCMFAGTAAAFTIFALVARPSKPVLAQAPAAIEMSLTAVSTATGVRPGQ